MASTFNRLSITALRSTRRIRPRRPHRYLYLLACPFHHTSIRKNDFKSSPAYTDLDADDRNQYDLLSTDERQEFEKHARLLHEHFNSSWVDSRLSSMVSEVSHEVDVESPPYPQIPQPERFRPGLLAMGEDEEEDVGEDEPFAGDEISSIAHGELEQHRELREYARIAAWEMPLLSKLAKPFEPPGADRPLRFRYTTYMGETHPAANKVALEFCTADLPLTPAQRLKLIKLVGVRYNPQTDIVKMSSESFETQAQNKRYLGDLVDVLMTEAKDETDTLEDIPVDFRHVKWKPKLEFPEQWKVTEERRQVLEKRWAEMEARETERQVEGTMVDGVALIEAAMKSVPVASLDAERTKVPTGRKVAPAARGKTARRTGRL